MKKWLIITSVIHFALNGHSQLLVGINAKFEQYFPVQLFYNREPISAPFKIGNCNAFEVGATFIHNKNYGLSIGWGKSIFSHEVNLYRHLDGTNYDYIHDIDMEFNHYNITSTFYVEKKHVFFGFNNQLYFMKLKSVSYTIGGQSVMEVNNRWAFKPGLGFEIGKFFDVTYLSLIANVYSPEIWLNKYRNAGATFINSIAPGLSLNAKFFIYTPSK